MCAGLSEDTKPFVALVEGTNVSGNVQTKLWEVLPVLGAEHRGIACVRNRAGSRQEQHSSQPVGTQQLRYVGNH